MSAMFGSDRARLRRIYVEAWRKHREGAALEPLERAVAEVVAQHPEYHPMLEAPDAAERDFDAGAGEANPFLHMAMHIAVGEQIATDRPAGIRDAYRRLMADLGDPHRVEHAVMECLGASLWEAQRAGRAPDEAGYLECVRRLARARR